MPLKIRNPSNDWSTAKNIRSWNGSSWTSAKTGKIWNGLNWVTFFDTTIPVFLPPSINVVIEEVSLNGTGTFYASWRIDFFNTGIFQITTSSTSNPETVSTYTWRNSGSSSDYEIYVDDPTDPLETYSGPWTVGQSETNKWIDLNTPILTWDYSITVPEYTYPTPPLPEYPTPRETYNLKSVISIALDGRPGTAITCPVDLTFILGV